MKRAWQVKVQGYAAFTMIIMDDEDSPEAACRAMFGGRLE